MTIINRWLEYLGQKGVHYSHSVHPTAQTALETARAERIPPHDLAKVVVYVGDSGYGIAVVTADEFVDLHAVGRLLEVAYIRLANEGELAELFPDCELGAMPPFGHLYAMPVLLDAGIAGMDFIAFPIGTHRDVVRMSVADYKNRAEPLIGAITAKHSVAV